ncbi:MAG: PSD1 and planctomycete cytochrome C domain-containing protein [Isosphaeraceae bacterium]
MRTPLGIAVLFWGSLAMARDVDYTSEVKPLLARHCVTCHGEKRPRGGLRLDTAAGALRGGDLGPSVVPGNPEESPLIEAVRGDGGIDRMPLKRTPLSESEIETLRGWIEAGAKAPSDERPTTLSETHWAFAPPQRPTPPNVKHAPRFFANPIDAFILARLDSRGLSPSPRADRATLVRRVHLDTVGLPPSPEEVAAFVQDDRPDAYERLVDRLLASPHFGERWARPWLDLARYADSNGYSIDAPRTIWLYRDWVIDAINEDLPFDAFLTDQLAGDLRPNGSLDQLTATGFHRNTPINQEGGIDLEQFRVESIVDRVNTTATAFLGLTVGCAQCHDHKYDPISQREYYQLFAFFNNVDEPELEIATEAEKVERARVRREIAAFHDRLKAEHPEIAQKERDWELTLSPGYKAALPPELKDAFDRAIDKRTVNQWRGLTELYLTLTKDYPSLAEEITALRAREPKFVTTMVVRERSDRRPSFIHVQGDFTRKGDPVQPGVPEILPPLPTEDRADRLALSRWLTDPGHPLTARVTVNRLWQAYFGRGIVETENDFGTQGTPPSHPELLDWLATELIDRGWSLKAIHRAILTSATYQQASGSRPELDRVDPENRLLGRQSRLRLDAELVRDAALKVSGLFSSVVGGPSVFPPQPDGVMTLGQMARPWVASEGPDRYRRGLYTFFWRATPHPMLTVFDAPNAVQACTRRPRSNTPLQGLTLLNDLGFYECAEALAARVVAERDDEPSRIERAFRLTLGRGPTDREVATLTDLLREERSGAGRRGESPEASERLAWTTAARVLLNLDEFITRE